MSSGSFRRIVVTRDKQFFANAKLQMVQWRSYSWEPQSGECPKNATKASLEQSLGRDIAGVPGYVLVNKLLC